MRRPLFAMVLAACGGATAYRTDVLPVPADQGSLRELAACKPGVALVPHQGGIVVAGWNRWWREPSDPPVESVACDEAGDIFYVAGGQLVMSKNTGEQLTTPLPGGHWEVVSTVDPSVFLYDRSGSILHYDPKEGLVTILSDSQTVSSITPIGTRGLAAVVSGHLIVWGGPAPVDLGNVGTHVDGLAAATDGSLYLSGPAGIVHARAGVPLERIATGIHGPLRARGNTLWVLWRESSAILRLEPHEQHASMFHEGPASGRKQSIDLSFGYESFLQQSALTASGDSRIESLTLADTAMLHGFGASFDVGPFLKPQLVTEARFAFAFGSAPIDQVTVVRGSGSAGQALKTSDLSLAQFSELIGLRIPAGYFSLRFGSGIEAGFLSASALREADGSTSGISAIGFGVPLWTKLELEAMCQLGVYIQGGYDYWFSGGPSNVSLGIGLTYRVARICY